MNKISIEYSLFNQPLTDVLEEQSEKTIIS